MTLYLKYRPQTIEEIDITSVRVTLTNILKSGSIPHAFLFAGPRGTGKTSLARILAKAINCESKNKPCNECESCISITNGNNIDVIEMDAASNRGIDDVRALRDIVKLAPANSKAKVYIVDEAHMLTTEASNALLKTLEEPPAHVYFILATTNPEKLIDTIKSRTTLVQFTKATNDEIARALKRVIDGEKIKIDDISVEKISKISKGSFRDAVKNVEQFVSDDSFLNKTTEVDIENLVENLFKKDITNVLADIKKSTNIENLTEELLDNLHVKLVDSKTVEVITLKSNDLIKLIELILSAQEYNKVSPIAELPLEMALIKWCRLE
jgi:DNA polymerase-3 subunit gamma/tau